MIIGVLLDTSVVLKFVLPEEFSDRADALLETSVRTAQPLLIPPLLLIEATNTLHQQTRRGALTPTQASTTLTRLLQIPLQQVQPPGVYEQALEFATTHQIRSGYDALYVVTAQLLDVELWTADRNLINALGTRAPWVRWIGDYAPASEVGTTS